MLCNSDKYSFAMMLQTIAGQDPKDATSSTVPVPDYLEALEEGAVAREHPPLLGVVQGGLLSMRRRAAFRRHSGCSFFSSSASRCSSW